MTLWPGGSGRLTGWSQPMPLARLKAPPAQPSHPPSWPQTGLGAGWPCGVLGLGIDLLKPFPVFPGRLPDPLPGWVLP